LSSREAGPEAGAGAGASPGAQGVEYFNCGDGGDNCSALVENLDGVMEIFRWFDRKGESPSLRPAERDLGVPAAD